ERRDAGRWSAEYLVPRRRLRQAVVEDRAGGHRDDDHVRDRPAGFEQARGKRAPPQPAHFVRESYGCEPVQEAEPDAERLAVRAPDVAPELRHERQRDEGVARDRDEQRSAGGALADELEPDDEGKPRDRRPAPQR